MRQLPRYRSGHPELDEAIADLVDQAGVSTNRDLSFELVVSSLRLGREHDDRGDLKLVNSALKELRYSMGVFAPYAETRKLSIFGSARTQPDHPTYAAATELGAKIAARDWMVITGAGPGIMTAGVEGAGSDNSFGVGITLPFEERAAPNIAQDPKLINFKYFFTRKLTFLKESHGFALLPGGFGTLDESFELLTLLQTGKTYPAPVVLLDAPGGTYWRGWVEFVSEQLLGDGLISPEDLSLVSLTDSVDEAVDEICGFFSNYHSLRFVGRRLVLRLEDPVTPALIEQVNDEFGDIVVRGEFEAADPTEAEVRDRDTLDKHRISFEFNRKDFARLRQLIDVINGRPRR